MKLYHYSKERHSTLLTKRAASGDRNPSKFDGFKETYNDHISFFFDPIPSKTVGRLFGKEHAVWFPGNVLYEYVIDTNQFENDIFYHVVESAKKTAYLDEFSITHDWVEDNPATLALWKKEILERSIKWGEIGKSLAGLNHQIKLHLGTTEAAYLNAFKRDDWEDGKHRYASNVPHLMIYPRRGEVIYEKISRLVIGNDRRVGVAPFDPLPSKLLSW